ncbi:MAG: hypothetical protein WC333_02025 [Dehalococcoidia bacterium]|jgi:hypothetical protein
MRIISVIEIKEGVVYDITSFGIDEANVQPTVDKAEKLFEEKCREYGYDEDDHTAIEEFIEDGYFGGGNFSICLTWSEI